MTLGHLDLARHEHSIEQLAQGILDGTARLDQPHFIKGTSVAMAALLRARRSCKDPELKAGIEARLKKVLGIEFQSNGDRGRALLDSDESDVLLLSLIRALSETRKVSEEDTNQQAQSTPSMLKIGDIAPVLDSCIDSPESARNTSDIAIADLGLVLSRLLGLWGIVWVRTAKSKQGGKPE